MIITDFITQKTFDTIASLPSETSIELCGVIDKDDNLVFLENIAENPTENFQFSTENYSNIKIVFHTHHLEESPSFLTSADIRESKKSGFPYLLFHTTFREWDYFDPNLTENPYPLIFDNIFDLNNLKWEWDRCDCYSLIRLFYKIVLGIELKDYIRPFNPELLKKNTWDEFSKCLPGRGFYEVFRKPKKYDVVVFINPQNNNTPSHIGVMSSDKHILHHPGYNQLSETRLLEGLEYPIHRVFAHISQNNFDINVGIA